MLQVGDLVFVETSAQVDVGFLAWGYVLAHPSAVVKQVMEFVNKTDVPEGEVIYALEWDEDFQGGHSCQGNCGTHRGQFVAGKHLSLCFEASREVVTVPHISMPVSEEYPL